MFRRLRSASFCVGICGSADWCLGDAILKTSWRQDHTDSGALVVNAVCRQELDLEYNGKLYASIRSNKSIANIDQIYCVRQLEFLVVFSKRVCSQRTKHRLQTLTLFNVLVLTIAFARNRTRKMYIFLVSRRI